MRLLLALAIAVVPQLACAQALEVACAGSGAGAGDQLRLKLDTDGTAQVQLPAALLPKHHTGDPDTWRKVDDFLLTDSRISGRYRFDLIRSGRFTIDRRTGDLAITASSGTFTGACDADPAPSGLKF